MELGLLGEPSTTLGKQPQRRERVSNDNDDGLISDSDLIAPHQQVEVSVALRRFGRYKQS